MNKLQFINVFFIFNGKKKVFPIESQHGIETIELYTRSLAFIQQTVSYFLLKNHIIFPLTGTLALFSPPKFSFFTQFLFENDRLF